LPSMARFSSAACAVVSASSAASVVRYFKMSVLPLSSPRPPLTPWARRDARGGEGEVSRRLGQREGDPPCILG
jgi:hypothetical protein